MLQELPDHAALFNKQYSSQNDQLVEVEKLVGRVQDAEAPPPPAAGMLLQRLEQRSY